MIEVTEADKRAAQNAFDSVAWGCPDSEMRCFVQAFAAHRIEAAKAERDRCANIAEDADCLGKDAFEVRQAIFSAIRSQP